MIWRGKDTNEREIELLCSMVSINGVDTLFIKEAHSLRIGTAYDPKQNDEEVKNKWLKGHPDFELTPDGSKVQRKLQTH